ncbi:hypothetical protein FCL48_13835 [Desulforhopalus sp. IMCC35007]|nr:hypothetical protein FCL48_13835 [Desulforhopalus sp. IMCC35007]
MDINQAWLDTLGNSREEVIGAINFGYGGPPEDIEKLRLLSALYKRGEEQLQHAAQNYNSRPLLEMELAKRGLQTSAKMISIVDRAQIKRK